MKLQFSLRNIRFDSLVTLDNYFLFLSSLPLLLSQYFKNLVGRGPKKSALFSSADCKGTNFLRTTKTFLRKFAKNLTFIVLYGKNNRSHY